MIFIQSVILNIVVDVVMRLAKRRRVAVSHRIRENVSSVFETVACTGKRHLPAIIIAYDVVVAKVCQ